MGYTKQQKQDMSQLDIPQMPHSEELERSVLGSLIFLGNKYLDDVGDILTQETFYYENHGIIYNAIRNMADNGEEISLVNLVEYMLINGTLEAVGGSSSLMHIANACSTTVDVVNKAQILREYKRQRDLITFSLKCASMASGTDHSLDEVIEKMEQGLTELSIGGSIDTESMNDATINYYEALMRRMERGGEDAISTGFIILDEVLNGGFHKSELIVFGGRPGTGKTGLSLQFARKAAEQHKKTLYINIEMTTNGLVERMASVGVSYNNLRRGQISRDELNKVEWNLSFLKELPLEISSKSNGFAEIVSLARRTKRKRGLDFLVIDYLQLMESNIKAERRQLEVGYMTRRLKALSKELDIPILLLSQLNRPPRGQEAEKPHLESLRESGDIEQDADVVIFTHRPDQTTIDENTGRAWFRRGMIIVAKNREGERDVDVVYAHDPSFKQFVDDGEDDPAWRCGDVTAIANKIQVSSIIKD